MQFSSNSVVGTLACDDGMIGLGPNCSCGSDNCLFATLRTFLPSTELMDAYINNSKLDATFSKEFTRFILQNAKFESHRGFPYDLRCGTDPDPQKLCKSSFGKFLRYNSIAQYARFNFRIFLKNDSDSLYEIVYPEVFRWTEKIPECESKNSGWNCAFLDMSSVANNSKLNSKKTFNRRFLDTVFELIHMRTQRKNHISQIVIYGKLLWMLSRPNEHVQRFINQTIEHTNIDMATAVKNRQHIADAALLIKKWSITITNGTKSQRWQPTLNWFDCDGNIMFCLSFRYDQNRVVYNSRLHNTWGQEGSLQLPPADRHGLTVSVTEVIVNPQLGFEVFYTSSPHRQILFSHKIDWSRFVNVTLQSAEQLSANSKMRVDLIPTETTRSFYELNETWSRNDSTSRNPPTVSMHVRQGDSCDSWIPRAVSNLRVHTDVSGPKADWSRSCFELSVYMDKLDHLRRKYGVKIVFLATDSPKMIQLTKQYTEYEWIFVTMDRHAFDRDRGWINEHVDTVHSGMILYSAVADVELLKQGDIFLGTFASHYSKLIYFTMVGEKMRLVPFVSLDFPMSCDTVDLCADEDVLMRKQTIEDIIYRSPNCQRGSPSLIGWVSGAQDPCGIYQDEEEAE